MGPPEGKRENLSAQRKRARVKNGEVGVKLFSNTIALFLLVGSAVVWAQVTAQMHGTVRDASGAAVPGAQVRATQTDTRVVRTVNSAEDGGFVFTNLATGPYQIEVSKEG